MSIFIPISPEILIPLSGGTIDQRVMRFALAADMPADISVIANVSGDRIRLDTFNPLATMIQIVFHSPILGLSAAVGDPVNAGPICIGARICINAADDNDANNRLVTATLTGAGTSSAGKLNVIEVSPTHSFEEIEIIDPIRRIDVIGIPLGYTPTNIIPVRLEVRVSG